jgi:hypothetical protein
MLVIAGSIALLLLGGFVYVRMQKSHSPEDTVKFKMGDLAIDLFYNRPYKKGRVIFGGLVPYDKVWRTGANEASTLQTNKTLNIEGKELPPGKYSIWTIPGETSWRVMFNSEIPSWGVDFSGQTNRNPDTDVVTVEVPAMSQEKEIEQFTILIEKVDDEYELIFLWDKTLVAVPFTVK